MTPLDAPEGSGGHSSDDWMRVLDRFLLDSGGGGPSSTENVGAVIDGGNGVVGGESSDDFFLFDQLDGSLFQDSNTNPNYLNHQSSRVGTNCHITTAATHSNSAMNRNQSSSTSLTSLLQNTSSSHTHVNYLDHKVTRTMQLATGSLTTNDKNGTNLENCQNNTQMINPQLSYTTQQRNTSVSSNDDEIDVDDELDDPEDDSTTPDGGLKDQLSKYERKRTLEKRRRLDTKSQFDALAVTLREVDQEFQMEQRSDNDESDTSINNHADCTSTAPTKHPKIVPPIICFKTSTNRLDLISRAITAINRLQADVHKLKKDKRSLKKVIFKLNALSSDHHHTQNISSSTRPTTVAVATTIANQQPRCTAGNPSVVNFLGPTVAPGIGPLHSMTAPSTAITDVTQHPSTSMTHTMPTMMFPYNHHPLFLPTVFPLMPIQQNYQNYLQPHSMVPMMPSQQNNAFAATMDQTNNYIPHQQVPVATTNNMQQMYPTQAALQQFPQQVPATGTNNMQQLFPPNAAVASSMQQNMQFPYSPFAYHVNNMQQQSSPQITAVTGPVQTNMQHLYQSIAYHVPYALQHPSSQYLQQPHPDLPMMEPYVQQNAVVTEPLSIRSPILQGQSQTFPEEDTSPPSDETLNIDPSHGTHLAHCA